MIQYRVATSADVPAMARSRLTDPSRGSMDPRVGAYLEGKHHPQQALASRVAYIASNGDAVAGYIAGHLTRRFGYDGELQYLFVAPRSRRLGIATTLLCYLARWFWDQRVVRVCVDVDTESPAAASFYRSRGATPLNAHWYAWEDFRVVLEAPNAPPA